MNTNSETELARVPVGNHVTLVRRGKQGKWTADYWWVDDSGKRHHGRKALRTRNARAAADRAREIERKLSTGEGRPEPKLTTPLPTAIEEFLTSKRVDGCSHKTTVKYGSELKTFATFLKETWGVATLQAVRVEHVDAYKQKRKDADGLESYTLHNHVIILKTFFKWCRKRKKILESPLADLELREPVRRRHPAASKDQVEAVLAMTAGHLFVLLALLAFTGLRVGEAAALRPEDVDLKSAVLHVCRRDDWGPKTEASERDVPIHPRLLAILKAWAGTGTAGTTWFIPAPACHRYPAGGHHVNPRTVNWHFERIAKSCGYVVGRANRGLTLHALRRFFKTFTLDSGVPKPLVDLWMGHRKKSEMDNFYYDPQRSAEWMTRVPFGGVDERELRRVRGGADGDVTVGTDGGPRTLSDDKEVAND